MRYSQSIRTFEGESMSEEGLSEADDVSAIAWMEPVPLEYRQRRAAIALGLGIACAMLVWALQFNSKVLLEMFWVGAVPLAVGVWRYRFWMALEEVRKYANVTTTFTNDERLKYAVKWWGFGVVMSVSFGLVALQMHDFAALAILCLIGFGAIGLVVFLRREQTGMTVEAAKQYHLDEKENQERESAWAESFFAIVIKPLVRYPLSGLLFWYAYHLYENPKATTLQLILVLGAALAASYELAIWLIGMALVIGLGAMAIGGIAALPLSLAVIIGALIIASAVNR